MARLDGIPGAEWPPRCSTPSRPCGPRRSTEPAASARKGVKSHPALEAFADPPGPRQGLLHLQPARPVGHLAPAPPAPHRHPAGGGPTASRLRVGRARLPGPRRRAHRRRDRRHRIHPRRRSRATSRPRSCGRSTSSSTTVSSVRRRGRCSRPTSRRPQLVDVVFTAGCYNTVAWFTRLDRARRGSRRSRTSCPPEAAHEAGAVRLPRARPPSTRPWSCSRRSATPPRSSPAGRASSPCSPCASPSSSTSSTSAGSRSCRAIERRNGTLWIGAGTTQATIERSAEVAAAVPLLARATPFIGHFQIRNRGTLGGSIAHADPAAEYPAVALALDAEIEAQSPAGRRTIPAADFFTGTWTTELADDEVLVGVGFPVWDGRCGSAVEELARRHGDFALAGAAVAVRAGRRRDR